MGVDFAVAIAVLVLCPAPWSALAFLSLVLSLYGALGDSRWLTQEKGIWRYQNGTFTSINFGIGVDNKQSTYTPRDDGSLAVTTTTSGIIQPGDKVYIHTLPDGPLEAMYIRTSFLIATSLATRSLIVRAITACRGTRIDSSCPNQPATERARCHSGTHSAHRWWALSIFMSLDGYSFGIPHTL